MALSPWVGMKWMALGLLALLIGAVWSLVAARQIRLWLHAGRYGAAELEVTKFVGRSPRSDSRGYIEGVIHPGGARVVAWDSDVSVKQREGPGDRWGRNPRPGELEGQRLPVAYWPRPAADERWWHPPAVIARTELRSGRVVWGNGLLAGGCLLGALWCFRRGACLLRATLKSSPACSGSFPPLGAG